MGEGWCGVVTRETIRKYAHEIYPTADEDETRPLAVEAPTAYAQAIGMDLHGTSWQDEPPGAIGARVSSLIDCRTIALLVDAISQGLTGDVAWAWVSERLGDGTGEFIYERAVHYGVDPDLIKPYPCGPEPDRHSHYGPPNRRGSREVVRVDGRESECQACTVEVGE